jgi:DTW domain-containing protein YfiP
MERGRVETHIADHARGERVPRCAYTQLTKPECHCATCLAAQIAAHRRVTAHALPAPVVSETAAGA